MDKAAAELEAIRLWRELPAKDRRNHRQAVAFAALIEPSLQFETLGKRHKIVEGWIVREFLRNEAIIEAHRAKREVAAIPARPAASARPAAGGGRPHPVLARNKP
jgi:hypothetical protein